MAVLMPVRWSARPRMMPMKSRWRVHLTPMICARPHFSWLASLRWISSISSTSSAMEPSLDSSRTRLREPMASAMRRLATYQREDSGMRRMPNHRATAGRVASTSM